MRYNNGTEILDSFRKELSHIERNLEIVREAGNNTTKLRNKRKAYAKCVENLERNIDAINSIKPHTYYSVEVAYRSSNIKHKAIMYVRYDIRDIVIFNPTYETMAERYCIEDIYFLNIIKSLEEMK